MDVGSISWVNTQAGTGPTGGAFNPVTSTFDLLKQIPHEEFGHYMTVSCNLSGTVDADTLAQISLHSLSFNQFSQLTASGGITELYAGTAVNDLLNFPLSGSGYYFADAKFAGSNEKVYVYLGRTDDSVLLPSNLSNDNLMMKSSGDVTYALENSVSLGLDDLGRAVYLLDVVPQGDAPSVTMAVSDNLNDDVTDVEAYAYTIEAGSGLSGLTPAGQTRALYPHHPDKPYITGIMVGANSVNVEVSFSDPVGTSRDGTGDLVVDDFDVIFRGNQQGSISDIEKLSDTTYRLSITGINSATVGANDRLEVRLAERAEDLAYKSLKTVYINTESASTHSAQRQGAYALQGAEASLRGQLRYTARFVPDDALEGTDSSIEIFVGRAGDTIGGLAYSNIRLSCNGGDRDSRLAAPSNNSLSLADGVSEGTLGTVTFRDNEDSDGTVMCRVIVDIDGVGTGRILEGTPLTLRDDDNAPVFVRTSKTDVILSESDGGTLLDASVELVDPDGPGTSSDNPEDEVVVTVELMIDRDNDNLSLTDGVTNAKTLVSSPSSPRLKASDAQAWLRTIQVVAVDGKIPPIGAEVTITALSFVAGADSSFGDPSSTAYAVSVQKASRIGQGLVVDDLEADIGVTEASTTVEAVKAAVAEYCGSGYYDDGDGDGVPNNVEVAIGTDCTFADNRDFVGAGRPAITLGSLPDQTLAFSSAPDSLEDMRVTCYDPDSEDNSCQVVVAYIVNGGEVCTETSIGGNFESECEAVFYTTDGRRYSYSASPGKVKMVWLGVGSDGDWAHTSTELASVIGLGSADYYLAPIAFVQFANPRASASGWVHPFGTTQVFTQLVLPPTHEGALGFGLDNNTISVLQDEVQHGVIVDGDPNTISSGDTTATVSFARDFSGIETYIAAADIWTLEDESWLYSSLSNHHSLLTSLVLDEEATESLNAEVLVALECGGRPASIIEGSDSGNCSLSFSENVTHWGYYVKAYSTTGSLIVAQNGLSEFQLDDMADPTLPVENDTALVPALLTTPSYALEVMHVVAAVKDEMGTTLVQRGASFPVTAVAQSTSDTDLDGLVDDGTIGDEAQFVARETDSNITNAFLFVSSDLDNIAIGPHAFSDGFNYDSGVDLSETKEGDTLVSEALSDGSVLFAGSIENRTIAGIGVFDFYMQSDVAFDNQPARVVIPLRKGLPAGGGTYWIHDGEIWNRHSDVYSASQPCPPVPPPGPVGANSGWSSELTEGDFCLLVELTDDCSTDGGASGSGDTASGCGVISDIATITGTLPPNAPISVMTSKTAVSFSENDGGELLDAGVELVDPDAGSEIPEDEVVVTVELTISGKDNYNLGLMVSGDNIVRQALESPSSSRLLSDAQAWLRTIQVVAVDGEVPPAGAEVTITAISFVAGVESSFGESSRAYPVSVQKASRVGQGLVADDLEAVISIMEASSPADTAEAIKAAVATYCGSGYYDDEDGDGVPNNVEVAIGTDCTFADNRDFVGAGRPAITLGSLPDQTLAFSSAPDSLEDMRVTCYDPDSEDNSCQVVVAYIVNGGEVCTETSIGGNFESECEAVFYADGSRYSYSASPGKVKMVWLGVGSDGDWAHTSTELASVIGLGSADYYLAPIAFVQFANPRASANGWVYPSDTEQDITQLVLPPTHEDAQGFMVSSELIEQDKVQRGAIVDGSRNVIDDPDLTVSFARDFSGIETYIATADTWILEDERWLYSSLSNNHSLFTASMLDEAATGDS